MSETSGKMQEGVARWARLIPAISLGLYLGRIVSEWIIVKWPLAILITLIFVGFSITCLRKIPFQSCWPLSLLLIYAFYPYPDPSMAIGTAALVALILSLTGDLGQKLPDRLHHLPRMLLASLLVMIAFFLLYLSTLSQDVLPADSGEFQLIATELGVAHPPGFPLYTMLAHFMTRLPLHGTPAYKVNLLSAITSSLTLLLVYLSVKRVTGSAFAGVTSVVALGASTTFWAQATTANIRSLTALFTALLFYIIIMITRPDGIIPARRSPPPGVRQQETSEPGYQSRLKGNKRLSLPALFVLVLVAGVTHHTSLIFIGFLAILFLFLSETSALRNPRQWPWFGLAILLGLLPLLYLPWRGAAGAVGSPEDITTIGGFINHILALGFKGDFFYFVKPSALIERLFVMVNIMAFQFPPPLLIAMLAGLMLMARLDMKFALLLGGTFVFHTLIAAVYRAPQTVEYMMPAYIPAAILLGYCVGEMNFWRQGNMEPGRGASWQSGLASLLMAIAMILAFQQLIQNYQSYRWLHQSSDTRDYAQSVLTGAPEDSVILADWHWFTPMRYLQIVEGKRPDLAIHFVFPTGEPYLETWARRIKEDLNQGNSVVATHYDEFAYNDLPPAQPLGEAYLFSNEALLELPSDYIPVSITLDDSIQLLGYKEKTNEVEVGQETALAVAWQASSELPPGTSLFVHLVGPDGQIFAQDDLPARTTEEGITLTQFRLTPRPDTPVGDHLLTFGVNNPESLPDNPNISTTVISQVHVGLASLPPFTQNPVYRPLAADPGSSILIGYDWDNTLGGQTRLYLHWQTEEGFRTEVNDISDGQFVLPELLGPWAGIQSSHSLSFEQSNKYIPMGQGIVWLGGSGLNNPTIEAGQVMRLRQRFATSKPVLRDQIVSLRLVGYEEDGFHWAWWDLDDGVPAMGAIPSLKWIAGSEVQDPHWLTVDDAAWPGQITEPLLRLYDAFSNRPLPILDERITEAAPWIPLGQRTINNPTSNK